MMKAFRNDMNRMGLFLLYSFCTATLVWGIWPALEGRLFPVTSKIHINAPVAAGEAYMEFTYSFSKLRPCTLIDVTPTLNGRFVSFDRIQAIYPKPPDLGPRTSPLWRLWSTTLDGFALSFTHQCPFEPWAVVTHVYP